MTTKDIAQLIYEIVGVEKLSDKQKEMIVTILELVQMQQPTKPEPTGATPVSIPTQEPNSFEEDKESVNLSDDVAFNLPNEVNLQIEGQEGAQKLILKPTPALST